MGGCLDFNATTTSITVTAASSIANVFSGGGSTVLWVNLAGIGENNSARFFSKVSGVTGWQLGTTLISASIRVDLFQYRSSGSSAGFYSDSTISTDTWTYIWLTYNSSSPGTAPNIWINGSSSTVTTTSTGFGSPSSEALFNLNIGNDGGGSRTVDGYMAHVQLFNSTLTEAQMMEATYKPGSITTAFGGYWPLLESSSSAIDLSGNANTGTISNGALINDGPPVRCFI